MYFFIKQEFPPNGKISEEWDSPILSVWAEQMKAYSREWKKKKRKKKKLSGSKNQDVTIFCEIQHFSSLPRSPERMGPEAKALVRVQKVEPSESPRF